MAQTVGTIAVLNQGISRLVDDYAKRGITLSFTFTAANDPSGGVIGSLTVTIPDAQDTNATFGASGAPVGQLPEST